jgi:serine/threonine protein kinase
MSGAGARSDYSGRSVGGGRYQLRDLLGQGGMAAVHLAHDTVLDRAVAVKTLHSDLGREQSFRERFRREAQAVAKLNHTNIVSVFDSGEDTIDGILVPYIVMEYVEGKPLRTVLDEDVAQFGAMPTEKALKITGDVLAALAESHSVGLVHRDIKPGNVMLNKRGVVKVMDFGIARAMQSGVSSMTQAGMVVGTPQYLSPEQALGRGVDERSDLYSVGCMLFELLTGRLPFDGDSPLAVAYQHVQEAPPAPSEFNRAVLPALDALVARSLKKNPQERFPTADVMRDEAERVAGASRGAATPLIIGEGPRVRGLGGRRGEEVSSAVFPQVRADLHTPPANVRTPYQPIAPPPMQAPSAQPHMQQPVQQGFQQPGYGRPAPPPGPAFGYPRQPAAQHPAQRPPYNMGPTPPPQQGPRKSSGGRTAAVVIGALAGTVVVSIVALVIIGHLGESDYAGSSVTVDNGNGRTSGTTTSGATATAADRGVSESTRSRTIDASRCTQAAHPSSSSDPEAVIMPDFYTKYAGSVENCMARAGWEYRVKYKNESLYGKGSVVGQSPGSRGNYRPKKDGRITIWVSTGKAS